MKSFQEAEARREKPAARFAIVVKSLDPERGGHENYINRLIRGLLERNYQIWCFAESFGSRSIEHANLKKVKITPFKLIPSIRLLWFNYRAQRAVKNHPVDFDFVFTTGNVTFGDVYRAGGGVHATYMENCLGRLARFNPKHFTARCLQERLFLQNTPQLLITNSAMVKEDIKKRYGLSGDKLRVIRNGIDLERFKPETAAETRSEIRNQYGFDEVDFVCLFTAGGGGRKGLQELLKAFTRIRKTKIKLLVVGRTNEAKLNQTLREFGLEERVIYAGFQPKIEQYYGAADCFVFPSKYDAAANVVCEALACGLPVISTATNGSSELIEAGRNGYVIEHANDYEALIQNIESLEKCEDFSKMREAALETGRGYSMERHIQNIEATMGEYLDR
ncbi:MAG: glycosyltransferase family 4 protein [Opitutales bacterium]